MAALAAAVVRAPRLDAYPPLHVVREPDLAVRRSDTCACGGVLVQLGDEDIPAVVTRHNQTAAHALWRAAREA